MNATIDTPATDLQDALSEKAPIVLIHGLWMTPKSWDTFAERFRARGHQVIVPGWPGIDDREVADIRRNPEALTGVGLQQIAAHYERIIRSLPRKPIIMGHSFGGVLTQMLADRNLGVAYVGIAPGQTAGVLSLPLSTLWTGTPILSNPFGINGAKPLSKRHFHFTFGNDLPRSESDRLWEEFAVNSYNRVFFEGVTSLPNEKGGITRVDYARAERAPFLVITGEIDHVVPPAAGKAIVKKYQKAGGGLVEYKEYAGRTHRLVSQPGWEEIADDALDWAVAHQQVVAG